MSESTTCPCCGNAVKTDLPLVDLNTNCISFRGETIRLGPSRAEMMALLTRQYPETVPHDKLIRGMWHYSGEPQEPSKVVQVQLCRTRKLLAAWGFGLRTVRNVGVRLERLNQQSEIAA